jgi:hypothetical protein
MAAGKPCLQRLATARKGDARLDLDGSRATERAHALNAGVRAD